MNISRWPNLAWHTPAFEVGTSTASQHGKKACFSCDLQMETTTDGGEPATSLLRCRENGSSAPRYQRNTPSLQSSSRKSYGTTRTVRDTKLRHQERHQQEKKTTGRNFSPTASGPPSRWCRAEVLTEKCRETKTSSCRRLQADLRARYGGPCLLCSTWAAVLSIFLNKVTLSLRLSRHKAADLRRLAAACRGNMKTTNGKRKKKRKTKTKTKNENMMQNEEGQKKNNTKARANILGAFLITLTDGNFEHTSQVE